MALASNPYSPPPAIIQKSRVFLRKEPFNRGKNFVKMISAPLRNNNSL
jgi:hypothetical protein